jgi:U32 family peptidase
LQAPVKPGDGVVFDAGRPEAGEEGGRIYSVDTHGNQTILGFGQGDLNLRRIQPGQRVWKTSDPALERELRQTFAGDKIRHQRPVAAEVHGRAGGPLTFIVDDREGHVVQVTSTVWLEAATTRPLSTEILREQLGRLGGTPFQLANLANHLEGPVILPVSELNRLRREAVAALEERRALPLRWSLTPLEGERAVRPDWTNVPPHPEAPAEIIAVTRDLDQFSAALEVPALATFYCEFENPKHYREAVARFRTWQGEQRNPTTISGPAPTLWVAPPRIFKPGEEWILNLVRSSQPDGYLVRNAEHLRYFRGDRTRGDFSLNVANPLTAAYLIERYGLERLTASYDLNIFQLESLLRQVPAGLMDITLHQHMPMFHMEHCVFCAFLSTGKDYRDCGRPCEKHRVALRDRVGADLPLKADAGCRNTVYNNRAQTGAEYAQRLTSLGARHFRIEFVHESPDEVRRTLRHYLRLVRGEISGAELWRELKLINQLGVTRGQMETAPQVILKKR